MYPLFETLCLKDGLIQNVSWHEKRYAHSFKSLYATSPKRKLLQDLTIPLDFKKGIYKLRAFYNEFDVLYEFEKYIPKKVETLRLVRSDDIDYHLKFSDRELLKKLAIHKKDCDDILITKNGKITDTSYANIVFTDGMQWFTPANPLLEGTCRARLLNLSSIETADISISDLNNYIGFNLINAMNDLKKNDFKKIENIHLE